MNPYTQRILDYMLIVNNFVKFSSKTCPKKKKKAAHAFFSYYYDDFKKVFIIPFKQIVSYFEKLILDFKISFANINLTIQQAIAKFTNKQVANYTKLDKMLKSI